MSALASILLAAVATPAQIDPEVIDACGEDPGNLCEWVYDQTGNQTLAKLSDWLVGTPLTVLCIVVGAWILAHLARRYLGRVVHGVMLRQNSLPAKQLSRVGIGDGEQFDPRLEARAASISGVVGGTAGVIIWVIALITVLGELGIDLGPLIAGAGIAGIALGFGAQSIVKDFLAGLFVLIEDQYGIGDSVDLGEASGTVQQISLADDRVACPGRDRLARSERRGDARRQQVADLLRGDRRRDGRLFERHRPREGGDPAQRDGMCQSDEWRADVLEPPDLLGVEAFASIGVTVRTLVKTTPGKQWALQRALREGIKSALDEAGIEIPAQRL